MRRALVVAFAVLAATLATTATPATVGTAAAAPASTLDVASAHRTASDFNNAQTLTNMTVTGSGTAASVEVSGPFADSFETQPADAGTPDNWTNTNNNAVDGPETLGVTTKRARNGTQSFELEEPDGELSGIRPSGQPFASNRTDDVEVSVWANTTEDGQVRLNMMTGGQRLLVVAMRNGDLQAFNGTWNTISTQPDGGQWVNVTVTNVDPANDEMTVEWEAGAASGAQTFQTETAMSGGYDETRLEVNSYTGVNYFDDFRTGPLPKTAQYVGANHTASDVEQAWANVIVTDATATIEWQAHDGSSWVVVNSTTVSSSGNYTVDVSGTSHDTWRANVTFDSSSGMTDEAVHDEGILFDADAPAVDNSSASPTGDLSTSDVTLEIDVNDSDFGTAQGDEVEVTFFVDGSTEGSVNLTANGTASLDVTVSEGGEHNWSAQLTDSYGNTASSDTFTFNTPSELRIYNESAPSQLVDNVTVELRFYFESDPMFVNRTTSNGTIDMTGLPADEPFVVVAEADGYVSRRIYVPSLFQSQRIYLLPESVPHVEKTFEITDYSGDFPQDESVLLIQRGLNGSWQTVEGDIFGATGEFQAQLAQSKRHQLVLLNTETGQRRNLGPYTPLASGRAEVVVTADDDIDIVEVEARISAAPDPHSVPAADDVTVSVTIRNVSATFANYSAEAIYWNGTANQTLSTVTGSAATGETLDVPLNLTTRAGGTLYVVVTYNTSTGTAGQETIEFTIREAFVNQYALLEILNRVPSEHLPDQTAAMFTSVISVLLTVLITTAAATQMPMSSDQLGLTALGGLAFFVIIGWLSVTVLFVAGVAWTSFAALRRGL